MRGPGVALAVTLSVCAGAAGATAPWQIPDAGTAAGSDDERAWRLFIALNWPASRLTRAADPQVPLGADGPVVWERWKSSNEIFRTDGEDPGAWEADAGQETPTRRFEGLPPLANVRHIVAGRMVPLSGPPAPVSRLIEVRMNQVSFEHIRARGLYHLEGQLRVRAAGTDVRFPPGSIQLKARWRPITPADRSRYHTLALAGADGRTVLYGLTALNIAFKDRPQWLWAAFEHEDNAHRAGAEGWQLPSHDTFACRGEAPDCGHAPQGIGLAGTLWSHYRLRGTMSTAVDRAGDPVLLASSELEAGLQRSSSCLTCHARASIGLSAAGVTRLPVFEDDAGNAGHGSGSLAAAERHRGYVGRPDPAWLGTALSPTYASLDFVWSLSRAAARERGTPAPRSDGVSP